MSTSGSAASTSSTLRFGILGAARIAPNALINPVAKLSSVEITRIAARDRSRAEAFASDHGIAGVADDYQALIEADDVDVVYNPLPMSLHATWTIAALEAGKHVLCEKPFASNATEAAAMVIAAERTGNVLGEAFHYRYHPTMQRVIDLVTDGVIGEVEHVDATFDIWIDKPDLRWEYATSGGSTMDLGCYPLHMVRSICGEPSGVSATAEIDTDDPLIDASLEAKLGFASGATATARSSMITATPKIELSITGTKGGIRFTRPVAPQNGSELTVTTKAGQTKGLAAAGISYDYMVRAFVDHVVHGAPFVTSGDDSIATMALIDACYQSAGLPLRGERQQ